MTTYAKATHQTPKTQQQPMAEWEELNALELEKVAGGLPPQKTPDGWVVYVWCPPIPETF